MGGVPPPCSPSHDHDSFFRISYLLFPFFSHICALFCAILYFLARIKYATLFFSSDSALFGKNARGGVPPLSPKSAESRSEEHTSELQSHLNLVCRLLLEKKNKRMTTSKPRHPTAP